MTRKALPHLLVAPDPEAAVVAAAPQSPATTGGVAATGEDIGPRLLPHLRPAAGPLLSQGPALILVATGSPHVVDAIATTDMAIGATAAPHHVAAGGALPPDHSADRAGTGEP